jgi:hypothetical protein
MKLYVLWAEHYYDEFDGPCIIEVMFRVKLVSDYSFLSIIKVFIKKNTNQLCWKCPAIIVYEFKYLINYNMTSFNTKYSIKMIISSKRTFNYNNMNLNPKSKATTK